MSVLRTAICVLVAVMSFAVSAPAFAQPGSCAIGEPDCCANDVACNDGNACNGVETCDRPGSAMGVCVAGTAVVCGADDDACTDLVCNAGSGACQPQPVANDTPCDDDDRCTSNDRCTNGVCGGTPAVFCAGDQCNTAGICNPSTGECEDIPKTGASCTDGDPCTVGDTCTSGGVCQSGAPKVCTASDQCHDAGTCNPSTGVCSNPAKPNSTPCSDGNACTQTDTCQAGTCTGANPVTCTASDQCHSAGTCNTATGVCSNPTRPNGSGCSDGNVCTLGDACTAGACTPGTPDACDDQDACTTDACDAVTGCSHTPIPGCRSCDAPSDCSDGDVCTSDVCTAGRCSNPPSSGNTCNDGNACTQTDTCQSGACVGSNPKTCTASDQCHDAGTCDTATGVCSNPAKANGSTCSDGSACTTGDSCQAGSCMPGTATVCTARDQCHDAGVCDPSSGTCSEPPKANGTGCNDGKACTQTDTCQSGICTGADPVVCAAPGQCQQAGTCKEPTGTCEYVNRPNGATCNDGNACTQTDTCQSGSCTGADPKTCTASDQCHDAGTCNPSTGTCSNPAKPNGATCNADSSACTVGDSCQAGACTAGPATTCTASDQCHDPGTCNPATGTCSNPAKANGATCNADSNACTVGDSCQSGSCAPGPPTVCTASDQCHDAGVCDPSSGRCSDPAKADGAGCNDGNACTRTDSCKDGVCNGAEPVVCGAPPNACRNAGVCNTGTGSCTFAPKTNGTTCSDGSACTTGDACQGGSCAPGSPTDCDDHDPCTADACDAVGGCSHTLIPGCRACDAAVDCDDDDPCTSDVCSPEQRCVNAPASGEPCSDGNACTQVDVCQSGTCVGSDPVECTSAGECRGVGTCDPGTGECSDPPAANDTVCDDGNACTLTDRCADGACLGANPKVCAASDECHNAGTCNPLTGQCSNPAKPNSTPCSDGAFCTAGDTCQAGACTPGPARDCTASGNQCNDGVCNEATDACVAQPKAGTPACDDDLFCTVGTVCQSGTCGGGAALDCTAAGDQCNDGVCNEAADACQPQPKAGTPTCDDGNACTQTDRCAAGACEGSNPKVCTASDQCHDAGTCNPSTGQCSNPPKPDATPCLDGAFCTVGDACKAGICSGAPRDCSSAADQCNTGLCDETKDVCAPAPRPDDTACSDADPCTAGDRCVAGTCTDTGPTDCDDADACTVDSCGANGCEHVQLSGCRSCDTDAECNDGNFCTNDDCDAGRCQYVNRTDACNDENNCTENDRCSAGVCAGTAKVCPGVTACLQAATCSPQTGQCVAAPRPDGTGCNDQDACTRTDRCEAGACDGSDPVVCTALDQCHDAGACNPQSGACSNPNRPDDTPCSDANLCTTGDRCVGGTCTATPLDCDDDVACTTDACAGGVCSNTPASAACDAGECATGACQPGAPDADARGCIVAAVDPDGTLCTDDGIPCTEDVCTEGGCRHIVRDDRCPPPNECGTAICQPTEAGADADGCVPVESRADGAECSEDDDPCSDDRCGDGTCVHTDVENYEGCIAVLGPWRRVLGLLDTTRAIDGVLAGLGTPDVGTPAELRALMEERLQAILDQLQLVERVLAGRTTTALVPTARADMPGGGIITDTPARVRGQIAFTQVKKTPRAVQAFLSMLTLAKQRAALDPSVARDLRKRGRTLLAGTKALKRDLKRLQKLRQSFAR